MNQDAISPKTVYSASTLEQTTQLWQEGQNGGPHGEFAPNTSAS